MQRCEFSIKRNLCKSGCIAFFIINWALAHDVYGSGYIGERYYTADGFDIVVYYYKGVVEQVRCINDDGTYTILK